VAATTVPEVVTTSQGTGLVWALKESLLAYAGRAGARVELGGGAGRLPSTAEFYFPLVDADFDCVGLSGTLRFGGQVRIVAHHGLLDIGVFDPWLRVAGWHGQLSVGDRVTHARGGARIDLVDVALPVPTCDGSTLMWTSAGTELTATGTHMFGESYGAGERFAPMSVRVPWDVEGH
jgi:hypothetical protein